MSKYRKEESSSEDSDSEEERRKKDIKERDEFANRLKAKDESKIRKVAMPAGSGAGKLSSLQCCILETAGNFNLWILLKFNT